MTVTVRDKPSGKNDRESHVFLTDNRHGLFPDGCYHQGRLTASVPKPPVREVFPDGRDRQRTFELSPSVTIPSGILSTFPSVTYPAVRLEIIPDGSPPPRNFFFTQLAVQIH